MDDRESHGAPLTVTPPGPATSQHPRRAWLPVALVAAILGGLVGGKVVAAVDDSDSPSSPGASAGRDRFQAEATEVQGFLTGQAVVGMLQTRGPGRDHLAPCAASSRLPETKSAWRCVSALSAMRRPRRSASAE